MFCCLTGSTTRALLCMADAEWLRRLWPILSLNTVTCSRLVKKKVVGVSLVVPCVLKPDYCGSTALAGFRGNEQADGVSSTTDITTSLQFFKEEMLRCFRDFPNADRPEHHSTDGLKEERSEERRRPMIYSPRSGTTRVHPNTGPFPRATLGRLLRDGAERVWAFLSATMHPERKLKEGTKKPIQSVVSYCLLFRKER